MIYITQAINVYPSSVGVVLVFITILRHFLNIKGELTLLIFKQRLLSNNLSTIMNLCKIKI
jgi:hypothetical protein